MAVGRPTHLFIVCSAHPHVGKTLTARLVAEFQQANDRPVAAFDLGTDEPALAEFLPDLATPASIADLSGQMALFEQLASEDGAPKVVDVGHRALAPLFMIMRDIDFAGEADRREIRPIILFVTAPDEASSRAYAILRAQFPSFGIVPVANEYVMQGEDVRDSCPSSIVGVASLQLPTLSADLQALIEQRPCSFVDLHRSAQQELPPELWAEFDDYLRQCFLQLHQLDVALLGHDLDTSLGPR
jgi:hypothetical protein